MLNLLFVLCMLQGIDSSILNIPVLSSLLFLMVLANPTIAELTFYTFGAVSTAGNRLQHTQHPSAVKPALPNGPCADLRSHDVPT
jgi:hypothetical protein